ncbi:unnamed protein product [Cyclocybe aegerita]|uniref:Uncharacterized protein n=1 Tax=Cyclocybe aegerita TaxID=1973307 RepID=A0A8S0WWS0_CYCAE|nr:unnamed protein product [Cyclocybe aegerita]
MGRAQEREQDEGEGDNGMTATTPTAMMCQWHVVSGGGSLARTFHHSPPTSLCPDPIHLLLHPLLPPGSTIADCDGTSFDGACRFCDATASTNVPLYGFFEPADPRETLTRRGGSEFLSSTQFAVTIRYSLQRDF